MLLLLLLVHIFPQKKRDTFNGGEREEREKKERKIHLLNHAPFFSAEANRCRFRYIQRIIWDPAPYTQTILFSTTKPSGFPLLIKRYISYVVFFPHSFWLRLVFLRHILYVQSSCHPATTTVEHKSWNN